ncbi:MAG TPA: phospholipase C, phosphocholine-specific [Rhizomicrobium sp.]|nr:phospholipase C, phosphocholine-specific [Rhizomicrobium sp.]
MTQDRRRFLKNIALTGAAAALPLPLRRALAIPPKGATGTIRDVEHVVILMQENRSFDHYFGTLRGVRGYGDPRTPPLPGGESVWHQPAAWNADGYIAPFHLDTTSTRAQCIDSLDHSWKGSQEVWKNHNIWIEMKGPLTMGYFTRGDIPFYYALADAFTICDAYHCSIFGPTNPNRLFLFTGTNGLSIGNDGLQAIQNPPDEPNEYADPAYDSKNFAAYTWPTYAERLQAAGVDWRVYQEFDNYGDNGLAYFANFRGANANGDLMKRGRGWPKGSNKANAAISRGEHLIRAFADDVARDRLPQVSWIVAPYIVCEHPAAPPGYGEAFTARLLTALASHPDVWAKTAFILNYDENDGFFDHVPPPVPPIASGQGKSSVDVTGEIYRGVPVGLGPRVPLIIVSPWTRGGYVNSQLADHTSVIRFLEARFGVGEPQISAWRRAVCGDLTSMFDFTQRDVSWAQLPATKDTIARVDETCTLNHPDVPKSQSIPAQETGQRPARALPYDLHASGAPDEAGGFALTLQNAGTAGAVLTVYDAQFHAGPWYYTIESGATLTDTLPVSGGRYAFEIYGPNGFLRAFHGTANSAKIDVVARYDKKAGTLVLSIANRGGSDASATVTPNNYSREAPRTHAVAAGSSVEDSWDIASSAHWYDLSVATGDGVLRRFAGHVETGESSLSDPALGRHAV